MKALLDGGGSFVTGAVSGHLATNADLINRFDGPQVSISALDTAARLNRVTLL